MDRPGIDRIYGKDILENEIKICELKSDTINPTDEEAIQELAIRLKLKYIEVFIIGLIFSGFIGFLTYDFLNSGNGLLSMEFLLIASMLLGTLFIAWDGFSNLRYLQNHSLKKQKYGYVKTKFYRKDRNSTNNRIKTKYYAHVVFPDENSCLKRVRCEKFTYHEINEGSRVLVVSFNDKIAHVISV